MKRLIIPLFVLLMMLANLAFVHAASPPQYTALGSVNLAPSSPQLTAVDPFANGLTPANPLKPKRPFWYVVDKNGLTIMGLRTERTGALMVGGPPIDVVEKQVVGYVPWPDAISITQPDGEVPTDPTITADHNKFAWRPADGWEPVGITVSFPTDEALASNSETPPTSVYVVMKHSGYEWQSETNLPAGRDPNLRDKIVAQPDPNKDGSLLVQVDVSQPNYPVDLFPMGPPIGGGLLGHNAGQPAFDPASDSVYVGNMPTMSLPTTSTAPNDLTSFVSVVTLAPAELPAPGEVPAPVTVTVLCGPEHPEVPILAGVPQSWACIAEGGEGPFQWTFTNLPIWLKEHTDPITGVGDGILYGTPEVGTWTFQAHVDDNDTTPPGTGTASITLIVTSDPTTEYEYGELEWEVGAPAAVAIEGTLKPGATGDPCILAPTSSPGSMVPNWVSVAQISGRTVNNTALGGPVENTIGCVVMGTPPISGERYEFQMPNFQFAWPSQNLPIVFSGQVAGPYTFDPLPAGVGLSGLAWHQIDKIHDPSTEADLLNREFFGVEPYTGQIYRIVAPYAGLEAEGTVVPPPALLGELDEIEPYAEVLTPLIAARPDIAAILSANPNQKVIFGDVAVEANPNAQVFVTATQISDPTGVDPAVNPIGGPAGSNIPVGALIKVSGTRDAQDPTFLTPSAMTAIDLPGIQAYYLGLDSDLAPAVPGEPGQSDNGVLWVTGTTTGNVATVDTILGMYTQLLTIPGVTSLGGVSVYPTTRSAYVASKSLQKVTIFGPGEAPSTAPVIWSKGSTTFTVGAEGWFKVTATGSPLPTLSYEGNVPGGVSFTPNGDSTATLAGIPTVGAEGPYTLKITATNSVGSVTQEFALTVNPGTPPAIASANTTIFTVGIAGSFTVAATGSPKPNLSVGDTLPSWLTFTNNGSGTATLAGTPIVGAEGNYPFTITATNGVGSPVTQNFILTVSPGSPPQITSANSTTFTEGSAGSFTVTATGSPIPSLSDGGATLPSGVTFVDNGNGVATLAGIPAIGTAGTYTFAITASNGLTPATQAYTLTVSAPPPSAPIFTSVEATSFTVASAGSFTVTATGTPTPSLSKWGTLPSGVTFTDNGNGTATLAGTPAVAGSYPFTITAANGVPPNATQNFMLTVAAAANNPPVATGQSVATAENTAKTITLIGSDPDGNSLTYAVVSQPQHGMLSGTAPNLTYTPPPSYNGPDSFTFKVNDGTVDSLPATVSITVTPVNDPPVATGQSVTTAEDTAQTIVLAGTDPENRSLVYAVVTQPQHGALTGTAPNLTYTPEANYNGADSFTFKVNDGTVDSTSATVSITVTAVNDSPMATSQSVTTVQDTPKTIILNGSDPDGNALTYAVVTQPQHGTLSGTSPNLIYTPHPGSYGPDSFTFKVNDGTADSQPATVSITVTAAGLPLAVTTTSLPDGTVGVAYSAQLQATGGVRPYTWSVSSGRIPAGMKLSSTGVISGKPNRADLYTFTVRVTDSASGAASKSLTLTIKVRPPRK